MNGRLPAKCSSSAWAPGRSSVAEGILAIGGQGGVLVAGQMPVFSAVADEYVELVCRLFDSWAPGAVVMDR